MKVIEVSEKSDKEERGEGEKERNFVDAGDQKSASPVRPEGHEAA